MTTMLFNVRPGDPGVFGLVAVICCWWPWRRRCCRR